MYAYDNITVITRKKLHNISKQISLSEYLLPDYDTQMKINKRLDELPGEQYINSMNATRIKREARSMY
eukprot:8696855-Ditylum_brightwellii.AAC.1